MLRILRDTLFAEQVEKHYAAKCGTASADQLSANANREFSLEPAYQAAYWLARLSAVLPPRPRPSEQLAKHSDQIAANAEKHEGRNPRVFGSVLDGTDTADSDLDLLVASAGGMTLLQLAAMSRELKELLGVEVDVITEGGLRGSMRDHVLAVARPLSDWVIPSRELL